MEANSSISNSDFSCMLKLFDKYKHNSRLRFFAGVAMLILTVAILDFIIGNLLDTFYFKQESGVEYRTTYSIEKTKARVLVFGSSTANHNYETNTFKKILNTSVYNAGRDGNSVFYDYGLLRAILKRYSPSIIILDFDTQEFLKADDDYDKLSSLLPYYKTHPEIRGVVDLKSHYEKYKLLSHIYPFNSSIFTIAIGNMQYNKHRSIDIDGYVPLNTVWNEPIKAVKPDSGTLDSNKINCYKSFITNCIDKKIKLYVVCSPLFIIADSLTNSLISGKQIADAYHIPFFDYSQDTTFLNSSGLFADVNHLNEKGASVFSARIADSILTGNMKK